ncbi:MAG: tetratricopeptide repeat protein, partial [Pseudomonadota bacterium]|nr:tetratricopeptide repeat protein [Pseudomonadota bacterium]
MIFPRLSRNPAATLAITFAVALAALLAMAWWAYYPGLSGSYLFDDLANINATGATGPIDHWATFWRYITSGVADPTGRPLTLLSFLIDARDWPADPHSFKLTNLLLHLLNGVLLAWAMLALGRRAKVNRRRNAIAAWLGTAFWLLHPLFVSTTLYIVQREAMLPATFTFIGLICWCTGRERLDEGRALQAWSWLIAGAWLCTMLATLSKANGVLLPLLIAVAECTVLRSQIFSDTDSAVAQRLRWCRWMLLGIPIALLALVMVAEIPSAIRVAAESRPWTIGQRLLSEPRILMDYLQLLWLPRATSYGLFNDQVRA